MILQIYCLGVTIINLRVGGYQKYPITNYEALDSPSSYSRNWSLGWFKYFLFLIVYNTGFEMRFHLYIDIHI